MRRTRRSPRDGDDAGPGRRVDFDSELQQAWPGSTKDTLMPDAYDACELIAQDLRAQEE